MKLIGENSGRTLISYRSTSMGIGASQQVLPVGDLDIGTTTAIKSGQPSFAQGQGLYIGPDANGNTVLSIGSDAQGLTWDGEILNVIGTIQALAAIISGDLQIGVGGDIRSGMTAFNTGIGFWLGTDASGNPQLSIADQFNNYILFDGSTGNAITINSTGVINVLSSKQTDDAGWSQSAVFGGVASTPTTRAGYGINDAQATLPLATAIRQALFRDNGGDPYFANQYDTNVNFAASILPNDTASVVIATGKVWGGVVIGLLNPGQPVNIHATVSGTMDFNTVSIQSLLAEYSIDGGATWVQGQINSAYLSSTTQDIPNFAEVFAFGVTPTGNVLARARIGGAIGAAAGNYNHGTLTLKLYPASNFFTQAPLAASIPATAAFGCSALFPITSCSASVALSVTGVSGVGPFTFQWSVVSGPGTFTSGSTSQTATLTDTETTASPGGTYATTVKCKVTDSQSYATTAGSQSGGTATVTIGAHFIPSGATVTVSGCTPSAYNGTFTVTGITATAIKYAVAGSPGAITVQGTVNNVNITTSNCVATGTFTRTFPPISASATITNGSCNTTIGNSCTASGTGKGIATGGNGSYTYSWTIPTISAASWAANVVTFTIGAHAITPGMTVQVTGVTPSAYNGVYTVTSITATTISATLNSNPGTYTSGGKLGAGTITAGSTAQTCTVGQTHLSCATGYTTVQCSINDTAGTGAVLVAGTVVLSFNAPGC